MLIEVQLTDGERMTVLQEGLDRLLEHNLVKRFKRRSGWVTVGIDPIRSKAIYRLSYEGFDRRRQNHTNRMLDTSTQFF